MGLFFFGSLAIVLGLAFGAIYGMLKEHGANQATCRASGHIWGARPTDPHRLVCLRCQKRSE